MHWGDDEIDTQLKSRAGRVWRLWSSFFGDEKKKERSRPQGWFHSDGSHNKFSAATWNVELKYSRFLNHKVREKSMVLLGAEVSSGLPYLMMLRVCLLMRKSSNITTHHRHTTHHTSDVASLWPPKSAIDIFYLTNEKWPWTSAISEWTHKIMGGNDFLDEPSKRRILAKC